jgi:Ca-activated chloride channel family protein
MIHFEWPLLILALPLPLLIRWLLPADMPEQQAALKVPFLDDFATGEARSVTQNNQWPLLLAMLAWLLLVFSCMRPQWMGEPIEQAVSGRDLMLAVDLSQSMDVEDFIIDRSRVDRLTATKNIATQFINRRAGDRLGLILFGTQAYLQTPLTFDRKTVITLLNESAIGLAGENTAIGDAIGLAVKRLRKQQADSRVLFL